MSRFSLCVCIKTWRWWQHWESSCCVLSTHWEWCRHCLAPAVHSWSPGSVNVWLVTRVRPPGTPGQPRSRSGPPRMFACRPRPACSRGYICMRWQTAGLLHDVISRFITELMSQFVLYVICNHLVSHRSECHLPVNRTIGNLESNNQGVAWV